MLISLSYMFNYLLCNLGYSGNRCKLVDRNYSCIEFSNSVFYTRFGEFIHKCYINIILYDVHSSLRIVSYFIQSGRCWSSQREYQCLIRIHQQFLNGLYCYIDIITSAWNGCIVLTEGGNILRISSYIICSNLSSTPYSEVDTHIIDCLFTLGYPEYTIGTAFGSIRNRRDIHRVYISCILEYGHALC
jgi:hypothetical protein